jgi:CubicO group peptidase (beta-lactamase class C family)
MIGDSTVAGLSGHWAAPALERAEQMLRAAQVPGAVLARISADGVDAIAAWGWRELVARRSATADSAFHLYSGTKLFTASAAMLLAERGELDLDVDVRRFLPELALTHPITTRQLLNHTSGLKDTLRAFFAVHLPGEHTPTTAEALSRYSLSGGRLPGRRVGYRNVDYAIVGELITRVAGMPYQELVRTRLLTPWRSKASFTSAEAAELATGYVRRMDPMRLAVPFLTQRHHDELFAGAVDGYAALRSFDLDSAAIGGLVGTVADFAPLVAEFLSDRDGVLRVETRRRMLTLTARGAAGIASKVGVGLGWKCGDVGGVRFWNHEGGGPGYCSELRVYPSVGVGFVILSNLSQSRRLSWVMHQLCEVLRHARS